MGPVRRPVRPVQVRPQMVYGTVPRCFPGETIVCIASGPSLTKADVAFCRDRARVIVVNDNYKLAPWANVLYAADVPWWAKHPETATFAGLKYTVGKLTGRPDVVLLKAGVVEGLSTNPSELRRGKNSGYQSINLAYLLGAKRIVLLGFDLQETYNKSHWFGDHQAQGLLNPGPGSLIQWREYFQTLVAPLASHGVSVVNCSRETALRCFPRQALADVLPDRWEAAS